MVARIAGTTSYPITIIPSTQHSLRWPGFRTDSPIKSPSIDTGYYHSLGHDRLGDSCSIVQPNIYPLLPSQNYGPPPRLAHVPLHILRYGRDGDSTPKRIIRDEAIVVLFNDIIIPYTHSSRSVHPRLESVTPSRRIPFCPINGPNPSAACAASRLASRRTYAVNNVAAGTPITTPHREHLQVAIQVTSG